MALTRGFAIKLFVLVEDLLAYNRDIDNNNVRIRTILRSKDNTLAIETNIYIPF